MIAVSLSGRIRAGCSLAVVVGLSAFGSLLLTHVNPLRSYSHVAVIGIAVAGLVFFVRGRLKPMHLDEHVTGREGTSESYLSEHPLIFLRRVDYWGGVLLAAALAIFFITRGLHGSQVPVVPPQPIVQEILRAELEFPELKLSGLVCNGLKSTAVIDGTTVQVGESIKGVKLVIVEPDGVIVEMNGNLKRLIQEEAGNQPPRSKSR